MTSHFFASMNQRSGQRETFQPENDRRTTPGNAANAPRYPITVRPRLNHAGNVLAISETQQIAPRFRTSCQAARKCETSRAPGPGSHRNRLCSQLMINRPRHPLRGGGDRVRAQWPFDRPRFAPARVDRRPAGTWRRCDRQSSRRETGCRSESAAP